MRISAEPLPSGCKLLRLHPGDGVEYIAYTIMKPISTTECELVGFKFDGVTIQRVRLALTECAKAGYDYCHITRKKGETVVKTRFSLGRYK